MDNITIGKMARMNGISEQTLRLYDRMGLLVPSKVNKQTGYRYYHISQCAKLDMIQYMKSLNLSLAQIKECFDSDDGMILVGILNTQKEIIRKDIRKLQQADWAIDRAIESYKRYADAPEAGTPVLETLDKRFAFIYDTEENCYGYDMEKYEEFLRVLKKQFDLHNLPVSYFCNPGNIIREENFNNKELKSTEMLLFVDESFADDDEVISIPGGKYICTYCNGFGNEEIELEILMDYVEKSDYKVAGDCISEVMIEFPTLNENSYDRDAFIKLQVPVTK